MNKEILVAIDGSVYSNQALSYLTTLFKDQEDIHFHLCTMLTAGTSVMPSVADSKNSLIYREHQLTNLPVNHVK